MKKNDNRNETAASAQATWETAKQRQAQAQTQYNGCKKPGAGYPNWLSSVEHVTLLEAELSVKECDHDVRLAAQLCAWAAEHEALHPGFADLLGKVQADREKATALEAQARELRQHAGSVLGAMVAKHGEFNEARTSQGLPVLRYPATLPELEARFVAPPEPPAQPYNDLPERLRQAKEVAEVELRQADEAARRAEAEQARRAEEAVLLRRDAEKREQQERQRQEREAEKAHEFSDAYDARRASGLVRGAVDAVKGGAAAIVDALRSPPRSARL